MSVETYVEKYNEIISTRIVLYLVILLIIYYYVSILT